MHVLLARADDVLRGRPELLREGRHREQLAIVVVLMVAFGVVYGAVMGSYSGARVLQMLYSGLKVPLLLAATFVLSLPSFFVINTLFGLRQDFAAAVRALLATQAGLTIILASLGPFTALWYVSFGGYDAAKMFNIAMFALASLSAQQLLQRLYRPLVQRDPRHRVLRRIWLVIYAFVAIQMAWVLRPFIGAPGAPTQFFRDEAWGNAYVQVAQIAWRLVGGG